jgi:hypothetical protein
VGTHFGRVTSEAETVVGVGKSRIRGVGKADRRGLPRRAVPPPDPGQSLDLFDRAWQRPASLHVDNDDDDAVYNIHDNERPAGTSVEATIRRLRKDAPEIHARVLAGEISAHAGMIEAGFRKKRESRKLTILERIIKLLPKLTDDEREQLKG